MRCDKINTARSRTGRIPSIVSGHQRAGVEAVCTISSISSTCTQTPAASNSCRGVAETWGSRSSRSNSVHVGNVYFGCNWGIIVVITFVTLMDRTVKR